MRRHSRHHYRLGAPEVGADIAPAAPSAPSRAGAFLTPKTGNLLVGAGLLTALGVVGYYVYKGGSLTDLWSRLTASAAGEESAGASAAIAAPKLCTVTLPSGATVSRPCNAFQATGPMATYTPPSSIANYIPQGLPSGRGGGGAGGVYRPAMDVY